MNRQEMFTRAVVGLKSQGWVRSVAAGRCSYDNGAGRRCAWGHVDPSLSGSDLRDILSLFQDKVGVAGTLLTEDLHFACHLQSAHDLSREPQVMAMQFQALANHYNLTFPETP